VPYISKVVGIPMCDIATRVSLGEKLADIGYAPGICPVPPYTAVKAPVFSFEKLTDLDTHLGPEMKSTGEVLGVGKNLEEALYKGFLGAGYKLKKSGGLLVTVRDSDKHEVIEIARKFYSMGFSLYGTRSTADVLQKAGMKVEKVKKIHQAETNTMTLIESGKINYIISTSEKGRDPLKDSVKIRRKAVALGIPCLTSLDTANAIADILLTRYGEFNTELVDINNMRKKRLALKYWKMQDAGNDYLYFESFDQKVPSPESLSIILSDRHYGVGSDGVVLIEPSKLADAKMRLFNYDGFEAEMAGNALRCVAKFLYDTGAVKTKNIKVETLAGVKEATIKTKNKFAYKITVNMGKAELDAKKIPADLPFDRIINRPADIYGQIFNITCVSMGNPHCVTFCDDVDGLDVKTLGSRFETHPLFPNKINVEFVTVIDSRAIKIRVWERGNGETLACGTGACAAVVAAALNGMVDKNVDIKVLAKGGELVVKYADDETVFLTGSAKKVFEGIVEV
jgi:carbamoyl-phosphate synthase large subunit